MKSNIKIVLFTLVILFVFSSMFKALSNDGKNSIAFIEENPNQIEQSGSWNLIGTTISIDNNWTAVKATNDWCTGEGTESAPYIIENVIIDAQQSGSCIEIRNSNDYFIIQNCSLSNAGSYPNAGITLYNVTNGKILNNYCDSNNLGIYLDNSDKNTVSGNNASYNTIDGIRLSESNNNTVSGNNACYNTNYGISLFESNNNMASENTVSNNFNHGILFGLSENNTVSENTVSNNFYHGITLSGSDNNTVSGNTVNNNGGYGINLPNCHYNTIFLNYLTNNWQNANDNGNNNTWDSGSIGNYWDDYQGVDANNDGTGDTPYLIPGTAGSQDNFPIWKSQPSIPFGNYFLLFTIIAMLSLTILIQQKKKWHLR